MGDHWPNGGPIERRGPGVGDYSAAMGEELAERLAMGEPPSALHRAAPDAWPSPLVVSRWRAAHPAFDALMRDAERVRAETLADESVAVTDDAEDAARGRARSQARQWLAARLDRDRYGERVAVDHGAARVEHVHTLSDAVLYAIATGGARVVDGVVVANAPPAIEAPEPPPGTPPQRAAEPARHAGAKATYPALASGKKNPADISGEPASEGPLPEAAP